MEATEQPRAAPFRQFDSTVTAPKGVVLRAEAAKTSEKVGSLKASDAVSVLELARTASGTTRARVSSTTKQAPVGWVTATTSTGKQFLAMPRTVPEAAALPEAVPAQGPEPEPEPEPEPKPQPMPGPEKRAELRKRLAATPFLKHKHPQFMHGHTRGSLLFAGCRSGVERGRGASSSCAAQLEVERRAAQVRFCLGCRA